MAGARCSEETVERLIVSVRKDRDFSPGIAASVNDGSMVGGVGEDFNVGGGDGSDG